MILAVVLVLILALGSGVVLADKPQDGNGVYNGNNAPSGPHYNLNIIGMENPKNANMDNDGGNTIFVSLKGRTRIMLYNSDEETACGGKDFKVLDKNGTDGKAAFCLPEPIEGKLFPSIILPSEY